jgi:hypothetical protein
MQILELCFDWQEDFSAVGPGTGLIGNLKIEVGISCAGIFSITEVAIALL